MCWDDDIPNIWKDIKVMFQTTNQFSSGKKKETKKKHSLLRTSGLPHDTIKKMTTHMEPSQLCKYVVNLLSCKFVNFKGTNVVVVLVVVVVG